MKKGITIQCIICNKDVYVHPCEMKFKKYCSNKCAAKGTLNGKKRKNGKFYPCPTCGKEKYFAPSTFKLNVTKVKFCSMNCRKIAMQNFDTKYGFKRLNGWENNPYTRTMINGKRYYMHRYIMEKYIGRKLEKWEVVHHINMNTKDNRIENLKIVTINEHGKIHKKL